MVGRERTWDMEGFRALPFEEVPCDIHCVTKWSKLGTSFGGVSVDVLLNEAEPQGRYVMAFCNEGYTTNLPLDDLTGGKAWVATHHEGEPLTPEHGGPARLLVPHLYFWKSAKWIAGLRIMDHEARFLGGQRLPPTRRPVEGTAVLERLTPVPQRAPGRWQVGTVTAIWRETPRVKTFRIELPMWIPHLTGQHYDVRLTAPDGYHAQRSYSIASSPFQRGVVELTIDRLEDGEVSPYFHASTTTDTHIHARVSCRMERACGPHRRGLRGSGQAGRRHMLRLWHEWVRLGGERPADRGRSRPPDDSCRGIRPTRTMRPVRRRARVRLAPARRGALGAS